MLECMNVYIFMWEVKSNGNGGGGGGGGGGPTSCVWGRTNRLEALIGLDNHRFSYL